MTHKTMATFLAGALLIAVGGYLGCGSDGEVGGATNSGGAGQGGNGDAGDLFSGGNTGTGGGEPCAQTEASATFVNRPVDIIVAIDNSGSMGGEIAEVEAQMTLNFGPILDAANPPIDYRVILVARHGDYDGPESICISQPLSTVADANSDGHCDSIPSQPTDTAKFFHHSVEVSSHNTLCQFRAQYDTADEFNLHPNGYKDLLRADAYKFFMVITDDGVSCTDSAFGVSYSDGNSVAGGTTAAAQWDADMLALSPTHFGDANNRNYTFWSIVALEPYNVTAQKPWGDPHPPLAPVTTGECPDDPACDPSCAVDPGTGYQALSVLTGGYRYPTCPVDYTEIFTLMAQGVIAGSQVPCEFEIPVPDMGQTIDLTTVEVDYNSNGTLIETLTQVSDPADCDAHSFYIQDNKIILCPEACAVVQADENAEMSIKFGCEVIPD